MMEKISILLCFVALASPATFAADDIPFPHGSLEDDCSLCHGGGAWSPASINPEFDHDTRGFKLHGNHRSVECLACHQSLEFDQAEQACSSCHSDVHLGELGTDCQQCHTATSFINRSKMARNHLLTNFPLDGAHRTADCESCHSSVGGGTTQFTNLPIDCNQCHLVDYLATTDPDHQAGGFPTSCDDCHSVRSFTPAGFNHNTLTAGMQCQECHLDNYQATTDPDHQAEDFPLECQACHSTRAWRPASFDHAQIGNAQCQDCHLDEYLAVTDPDHQAGGFPLDCMDCHSTNAWEPASFDGLNHDQNFFPIFSGKHRDKWDSCSDCHTTPSNFVSFSCIDCHEHDNPSELADKHSGESGYEYNSMACFECHPTGSE
jgi:hypothetical protein